MLILPGRSARGQRPTGPLILNRDSPQVRGLVAWWPLGDGGWREVLSGISPQAVGTNGPTVVPHQLGGLAYDGIGGGSGATDGAWLDVSNVPLGAITTEATVAFWVRLRNATPGAEGKTGFPVCFQYITGGFASHYPWTDGTAYVSTFRSASGGRQTITLASDVDRASWHLVAVSTRNGSGNWRFAQNGRVIYTAAGEASVTMDATARWIGATDIATSAHAYGLDGQVADVRLWRRALSDAELWALYDPATRWDLYWQPSTRAHAWYLPVAGGSFNPAWAAGSNVILGATPC